MDDIWYVDIDANCASEQTEQVREQAGFALRDEEREELDGWSEMAEAPFDFFFVEGLAIEESEVKNSNMLERLEMFDVVN